MEEIFRDIDGFEGKYQISQDGNVLSLNYLNTGKPRILKPKVNKQGYLEVTLNKNDKHYYRIVHRLVFETFMGVKLGKNDVLNPIDGDKQNVSLHNWELITRGKRQEMSYDIGTRYAPKYDFYGKKMTTKQLSKVIGLAPETIRARIINLKWGIEEAAEVPLSKKGKKEIKNEKQSRRKL